METVPVKLTYKPEEVEYNDNLTAEEMDEIKEKLKSRQSKRRD